MPVRRTCAECGGRGETWNDWCVECAGIGDRPAFQAVNLRIPAGVQDGRRYIEDGILATEASLTRISAALPWLRA